jgi:hypothetical protein
MLDFQCKVFLEVSVMVWKWASVFKRTFILRFCKEKLIKSESIKTFYTL